MKSIFIHPFKKHFLRFQFDLDIPLDVEETKIYKTVSTMKVCNLVKGDKKKLDNYHKMW